MVAVDWGTSSFRAWLLSEDGAVLNEVRDSDGTFRVSGRAPHDDAHARAAEFAAVLDARCGRWLATTPGIPVVAAGMVGSNQGWSEVPYLELPADLLSLPDQLVEVTVGRSPVYIVPGLRQSGEVPDVIRGEEVQIVGALPDPDLGGDRRILVLPGTHSKWVEVKGSTVMGFTTVMTGELFGLVMKDSIIGRLAAPSGTGAVGVANVPLAFERGLAAVGGTVGRRGLASALFTGRTLVMAGRLLPDEVGDYVSGLLIGDEVAHFAEALSRDSEPVIVCGTPMLCALYTFALARHGAAAVTVTESVSARGLWLVAQAAGLVSTFSTSGKE